MTASEVLVTGPGQEVPTRPVEDVPLWRRAAGAGVLLLGVVGTWWFATLPALTVTAGLVAVLGLDDLGGAVSIGLILVLAIGVEAVILPGWSWRPLQGRSWCPDRFRMWGLWLDGGHSVERTLYLIKRLRWHRIASRADLTAPVDGFNRAPDLVAYRRDLTSLRAGWCQYVVRPLVPAPREIWSRMGDQLVRSLDWAEATTEIGDRARVTITMTRDPLPRLLPAPDVVSPTEGFVALGATVGNSPFGWSPDNSPHLTVTGITGGGKGSTVRLIERHGLAHGWLLFRANPKLTGESAWLDGHASVADTPPGMWAMADHVYGLMRARQERVKTAGVDSWLDLPDPGPRVVFIIDESANLISPALKDERRPYAMATSQLVTSMAQMARSAGVHLVIIAQQPGVDSYGWAGGQTRLNIGARMIIGRTESIWVRELFVGDIEPSVVYALAADVRGRAVYQGLAVSDGGRACKGQVFYLSQDDAARSKPATPAHDPIDFNAEGPERWAVMVEMLETADNPGRSRRNRRKAT
jgi:hypothetical protein